MNVPIQEQPAPAPFPELKQGQTELWQRYRAAGPGDSSEEALVKAYVPLVKTVVGRLAVTLPAHLDPQDLYSAGLVGLLNAVRQFNSALGIPFEAYARVRIRGAVLDELRRMDWVARTVHVKARQIEQAMAELEQTTGRLPTDAEVAAHLQISPAEYENWLDEVRPATFISLDVATSADGEEESSKHETLLEATRECESVEEVSGRELEQLIRDRIEQLPDLQKKILALHYFEDMRLNEIAEALGYSPAHICQTHARAIIAIRAYVTLHEAGATRTQDLQP